MSQVPSMWVSQVRLILLTLVQYENLRVFILSIAYLITTATEEIVLLGLGPAIKLHSCRPCPVGSLIFRGRSFIFFKFLKDCWRLSCMAQFISWPWCGRQFLVMRRWSLKLLLVRLFLQKFVKFLCFYLRLLFFEQFCCFMVLEDLHGYKAWVSATSQQEENSRSNRQ